VLAKEKKMNEEKHSAPIPEMDCPAILQKWEEDLLLQMKSDPTIAFLPDHLFMFVHMQTEDLSAYEKLREKLKTYDLSIPRLETAIRATAKNLRKENERKPSTSSFIIELASNAVLYHTEDGTAFADVSEDGVTKTWPINSSEFEMWLRAQYFQKTKSAPGSDALSAAKETLAARAIMEGEERPVYLRCAWHCGNIYIDLCDEKWRAIEITSSGFHVTEHAPVRFRRKKGMRPLPVPEKEGNIELLRPFLNVSNDHDFYLVTSWILSAMRGKGPFPILIVVGEQGTAKSTFTYIIRQLVDATNPPQRSLPSSTRDLFIAANNTWVLAFDNLSYLSPWLSDSLCSLSTGGGFATRQLHTDEDEVLFNAMRPIIMNGIENVANRGDLLDRAIILSLNPIPKERRKPAEEIQKDFNAVCPAILGGLCNALSEGLRQLPNIRLTGAPRMADFMLWSIACEKAFCPTPGLFSEAYETNQREAVEEIVSSSPLALAVLKLMSERSCWKGTATELLKELAEETQNETVVRDNRLWPKTPKVLSERLKRFAPALRENGIEMTKFSGPGHSRIIVFNWAKKPNVSSPPPPSAPSSFGKDEKPQTVAAAGKQQQTKSSAKFTKNGRRAHRAKK
jgi:hypothetical protein